MKQFEQLGKQVKFAFMRMTETEAAVAACVVAVAMVILAAI
jgi:hypothetical protein